MKYFALAAFLVACGDKEEDSGETEEEASEEQVSEEE